MSITIQEAIKAIYKDIIVKNLHTGYFFRKSKYTPASFDFSHNKEFSNIIDTINSFSPLLILSEWEIAEQDEQPKPCIFCGNETILRCPREDINYVGCKDIVCGYDAGARPTKKEAIRKHNELYDRLNPIQKDSSC